jgi:hypothetical protein
MHAKVKRDPGGYYRWLPRQDRFLRDPSRRKLIRAGNQHSGKTTVALYELIGRCLGTHPAPQDPQAADPGLGRLRPRRPVDPDSTEVR